MSTTTKTTWIQGENGNRASVEFWGSEEAARQSLATLKNCSRCADCSYCSYCSDCSNCSYCLNCANCADCAYCANCSYCSNCSNCSYCANCSSDSRHRGTFTVPHIDNIHKAVYSAVQAPDALNMSRWHTCDTTHCRAGWVVHLAGEPGYALEKQTSTVFAAMQIYKASGYEISPVRFFDTNEDAMADMKRLSESAADLST